MTTASRPGIRFAFATQLPRDDGCGVFVLQMLTGRSYDEIASLIDWGDRQYHHTEWNDLRRVLSALNWNTARLREAAHWNEIQGVAIVYVDGDHFILYDADNGAFYDPGLSDGPALGTHHTPVSYLQVRLPDSAV